MNEVKALTDKEKKHHELLLFMGERTYNRLMMNLINAKTRLVNMVSINLIVLSLLSSISLYIFSLGDENKFIYYRFFLGVPIGILIFSFLISVYGLIYRIEGWEIVSFGERDFEDYMKMSEEKLYDDFLINLKKGLEINSGEYKKLVKIFDISLILFSLSVIMIVIYVLPKIMGVI